MNGKWKGLGIASLLVSSVILPGARPAAAYSGPEHSQISNLALWVAYESQCRYAAALEPACDAARDLFPSPCTGDDCENSTKRLYLGDYTRAGDHFTGSARIVADPDGCQQENEETCWEKLMKDCKPPAEGCLYDGSAQRILKRQKWHGMPMRIAATHRNTNHFREFARNQYKALHSRAVTLAQKGQPRLALATEGVALHFLQDLFSAGHLASARADFADAASGSMHDRFNRQGLPFRVNPSPAWCELLDVFQEALKEDEASHLRLQPPPDRKKALTIDSKDLEKFAAGLGGCTAEAGATKALDYEAYGDGALLDRKEMSEDSRLHRIFLVLASAWSIRQVLLADAGDGLLEICFQYQSASATETSNPSSTSTSAYETVDENRVWAPGAVLTETKSQPLDPIFETCQPDLAGALAGYRTCVTQQKEIPQLTDPYPRVSILEVAWSPFRWGEANGGDPSGARWELGWTFIGEVPQTELLLRSSKEDDRDRVVRTKEGNERRFNSDNAMQLFPLSIGLAAHYEGHAEYSVWGAGILGGYHQNFGTSQWNVFIVVEPGYAHYQNNAREVWRWRASARAGVGYGVLFFEIAAERGFALDSTGDGHREWRYFAGPRVRLSSSWLTKYIAGPEKRSKRSAPSPL